jgi:hypothetical protein
MYITATPTRFRFAAARLFTRRSRKRRRFGRPVSES